MKNIPMFTGAHGVATLILQEIAVSGKAYVMIRSVWNGRTDGLLEECRGFCRAVGAEAVYASWEREALPAAHAYDILQLTAEKAELPPLTDPVALEPLTKENGQSYLEIYNHCFWEVDNAASYGKQDLQRLLGGNCAFLVKRQDRYAAVVELGDGTLEGIGVLPAFRGLGYPLALTALHRLQTRTVSLKVASTNLRALDLYERLGFHCAGVVSRWYQL